MLTKLTFLLNTLFPQQCVSTDVWGWYLSQLARRSLTCHPPICLVCKKFQKDFCTHIHCRKPGSLDGCLIAFSNSAILKKLIYKLKYLHRYDVADVLADLLGKHATSHALLGPRISHAADDIVFSCIPSHWFRKYFLKGYNQSSLLSKKTAWLLWVSYSPLLHKSKHTRSQVGLSRTDRETNLSHAFSLHRKAHSLLAWKKIVVLVDDIVTTGSTLQHATTVIKHYFPHITVRGLVVARNW